MSCSTCRPPKNWSGEGKYSGFVTEQMLAATMPKAGPKSCVLVCGPPIMIDRAVRPNLENIGFTKANIHAF